MSGVSCGYVDRLLISATPRMVQCAGGRGGEGPPAHSSAINGTLVVRVLGEVVRLDGLELNVRHRREENLCVRFLELDSGIRHLARLAHTRALEEETARVDAVLRLLSWDIPRKVKVKLDGVDGQLVLARVVLQRASHEGLDEEEVRHRVADRIAVFEPVIEEAEPFEQLRNVGCERLEGRV
eukprot:scaffold3166_cov111-Isochrysis_galbana.AAC.3